MHTPVSSKQKYRRALVAAALLMSALPASADVIYREVFGNATAPNSNFLSLGSNWGWAAYENAGGTLMSTAGASIASDLTTPSNIAALPAVNSGTTGTLATNGRTTLFPAQPGAFMLYTEEYVVNRQLNDITTATWDQRQGNPTLRFAVQIGGVWYASKAANAAPSSPSGSWNTGTIDFKDVATTWQVLNFVPGGSLALVAGNVPLPTGNITAFGIFCPSGAANGCRLDGVTINATPIIIPNDQWAVGSGDWDTTSANWQDGGVGALVPYVDGYKNVVTLNDLATSDPVLINLTADRSPITLTVDSTKNYTLSGSAVTGETSLTKAGTSTLTLSNPNTYNGATSINAGTVKAGVANAIPSGTGKSNVAINGGATVAGTFDVNGLNVTINGLTGATGTVSGTVINNSASAGKLTLGNGDATATFAGVLANGTGTLALEKVGTGIQSLTGVNTFTGGTTVTAGSLVVGLTSALPGYDVAGKVVFNGGTLAARIGNGTTTGWTSAQVDTLLVNATKTSGSLGIDTTSGNILQAAAFTPANLVGIGLTKLGANTLTLDQVNTYAGTTTVSGGTLKLGNVGGNALPDTGTVLVNGGTLDVATNETIGTLTLNSGTVSSSTAIPSVLTVGTYNFTNSATATFALPLLGSAPLAKTGAGTLNLTGNNTGFSGGWTLSAGGFALGSTTALGTGPLVIANGTSLDSSLANLVNASNNAVTINGDFTFNGSQNLNLGTGAVTLGTTAGTGRIITTNANTLTLGGVIANGTTATGITKAGAGGITLSGNNTYTGGTTIKEGTINVVLNGNIDVSANSPLGNTPSGTNIVVGTATSSAGPTLNFVAGNDSANYTFSRLIDSTQGNGQTAVINFNGDGAGGLNTNTLTLAGDVAALYLAQVPDPVLAYGGRTVRLTAQRTGLTINVTGNIPAGTGQLQLNNFPSDPNVDGRGQGTIRFSNVVRYFTGTPVLNYGTVVIDGVVDAVGIEGPIGTQAISLNQASFANIVGNANFTANAGASRDTSADSNRGIFLDSAGSSYARILAPGPAAASTANAGSGGGALPNSYGTGTIKTVNVINGYQFGGLNTSGSVLFSGAITPADVTVGSHPTNVITVGSNIALIAETGGTTEFSGVISDTPLTTNNVRVTVNQVRNHPNIDGINNATLTVGPDGIPDSTANQLVGTAKGGTVVLSAATGNLYEGGTEILGGTLLATNTSGSATGLGTVTIQAGGKLGGSGFIAPTLANGLVVNSDGAISLADGAASGDFDVNLAGTGNATFAPGAKLAFDVAASGTSDLLKFTGLADSTVAFNNTIVDLTNVGGATVGATYTLMTFDTPSKYTGTLVAGALPSGISGATFAYNASAITVTLTGVAIAPAQPTTIVLTASGTSMNVSWTPSARATSYTVKRSTTNGGGYVDVATNVTGSSYSDTGLTAGTTYYYVVTATGTGGTSASSTQSTTATLAAAPGSLTATTSASASVTLNWAASPGATGYLVRRSTTSGGGYVDLLTVAAPTVTFVNNSAVNGAGTPANGTTYYYVVAPVNAGGIGANSAEASATPVAAPSVPTGLVATASGAAIDLSWNAAANAATYTIRRSTTSGSGYTDISAGVVIGTTYQDTNVVSGTTYYYVIASVNTSGTSANSTQASATATASVSLVEQWRTTNFPGSTATTGLGANNTDFDGDGIANLAEYALGTDAKVANASPITVVRDASGVLKLSFPHIADATLVYAIKGTNDLTTGFGGTAVGSFTGFTSTGTTDYLDAGFPLSTTPKRFLRLEVIAP